MKLDQPESLYYYSYRKPKYIKNTCSNFNKIIFIKENYLEKANNLEINNKNINFYLLSNKKYNINKSGKVQLQIQKQFFQNKNFTKDLQILFS